MPKKTESKKFDFFKSGLCLIIGFMLLSTGAITCFLSAAFAGKTALILAGSGFTGVFIGGAMLVRLFEALLTPNKH